MGSRYQFRKEEIEAIEQARQVNKDKRAEQRLKALELRANCPGVSGSSESSSQQRTNLLCFEATWMEEGDAAQQTSEKASGDVIETSKNLKKKVRNCREPQDFFTE